MPKTQKQPIIKSRKGWDKAFRRMHQHGDDALLDREAFEKRAKERSRPFEKVLEGNAGFWRLIERRRKQPTVTMADMRKRVGSSRVRSAKRRSPHRSV